MSVKSLYHDGDMDVTERIRLGILLALGAAALVLAFTPASIETESVLKVHFLDVGQGDAILIQTPDGKEMLIDGGRDQTVLTQLADTLPLFHRSLHMVVATHPDLDHIGGLIDVLRTYEVESLLITNNAGDSAAAETFTSLVNAEQAELYFAQAGQSIALGASTTITVLSPFGDVSMIESNNSSIVLRVSYGNIDFMLTGDAGVGVEEYLVATYGAGLESEVLKLGHHGSRTSTSDAFLTTVQPQVAVVSAGLNNSYGHPHAEVVSRVAAKQIDIVETAEEGTITFVTDGVTLWRE